jgi:hypothetical protein
MNWITQIKNVVTEANEAIEKLGGQPVQLGVDKPGDLAAVEQRNAEQAQASGDGIAFAVAWLRYAALKAQTPAGLLTLAPAKGIIETVKSSTEYQKL